MDLPWHRAHVPFTHGTMVSSWMRLNQEWVILLMSDWRRGPLSTMMVMTEQEKFTAAFFIRLGTDIIVF
jgi:hypothetical protein